MQLNNGVFISAIRKYVDGQFLWLYMLWDYESDVHDV